MNMEGSLFSKTFNRFRFMIINCFVRKILFREKGSNPVPVANGIEVESENTIYEIEGKTIILSAGSIGSPHLLLLSGIGPKKQLEEFEIEIIKDLPGVGKNLRDHGGES